MTLGIKQNQLFGVLIGLIVILLLSGCTTGVPNPSDEQAPQPTLVLNNTANDTHTFNVWIVDRGAGRDWVTVSSRNKRTYTLSPQGGVYHVHFPKENVYVTEIKPDKELSQYVTRATVQPGETHRQTLTNFSVGDSLMVTAAEDDRIFELVVSNCGEQSLIGLEVMSILGPSTANSFGCR